MNRDDEAFEEIVRGVQSGPAIKEAVTRELGRLTLPRRTPATHRCTILESEVDPEDLYGVRPRGPVAVWGWGSIPDQYGRNPGWLGALP